MKKVIFVCLLSLALCNSAPQGDQATKPQDIPKPQDAPKPQDVPKPVAPNTAVLPKSEGAANGANLTPPAGNAAPAGASNKTTIENAKAAIDPKSNQTQSPQITNPPDAKTPSVAPGHTVPKEPTKNDTTNVPSATNNTFVDKNNTTVDKNNNNVADNSTGVKNNTKSDDGKKPQPATNGTATVTPPVKPTEASKADNTTKQNVVLQTRSFDGPSFIGGIILTLGLIAVGFMGLKYYRAQTERNYHTL